MLYVDLESVNKESSTSTVDMARYNNGASANQHIFGSNSQWTFIDCYWCCL